MNLLSKHLIADFIRNFSSHAYELQNQKLSCIIFFVHKIFEDIW